MSMTENEAINELQANIDLPFGFTVSDEVSGMAIQALEEIQQYRAIGTVEQLKTIFDGFWKLKDLCEEYEKYGLPEDYWKLNEICKEYSAIGTIEEFQALKEKNEPKRLLTREEKYPQNYGIYSTADRWCPCCRGLVFTNDWPVYKQKIMYKRIRCGCGQKLDWE